MTNPWDATMRLWSEQTLKCGICGSLYKEIDNIGRWNCVQTVTRWDQETKKCERYLVQSDHRIDDRSSFYPTPVIEIPRVVFTRYVKKLKPRPESIYETTSEPTRELNKFNLKMHISIRRYDKVTADRFLNQPLGRFAGLVSIRNTVIGPHVPAAILLKKSS